MPKLYRIGSNWLPDRHVYLHQGSTILITLIEVMLYGPQLRTITNVDIPIWTIGTVSTKQQDLPSSLKEPSVYEVSLNKIITKEYPNLAIHSTIHLRNKVGSYQTPIVLVNTLKDWIEVDRNTILWTSNILSDVNALSTNAVATLHTKQF